MTTEYDARRFTLGKSFLVGLGFLGFSVIWPIFNQLVPIFLQAGNPQFEAQLLAQGRQLPDVVGFGLAPALALFIMTWDNLINMFVQPWIGSRSDKTWTRFGRRKPYIMLGAPIAALGFILVPFAQSVLFLAVAILITTVGMALFRTPTTAWLGDLFAPEARSKASGILNMMAASGNLLSFVGGGLLFTYVGRAAPFVAGAVLMLATTGIAVWRVREIPPVSGAPVREETRRTRLSVRDSLRLLRRDTDKGTVRLFLGVCLWFTGFFALEAGVSSFAVFSLGIDPGSSAIYTGIVSLSFILFAWPAGIAGTRWGHRKAILVGLIGLAVLFGAAFFVVRDALSYTILLFLMGVFWDLVNVNSLPTVYAYGEESRIGAFTGLYFFALQLAAVLGPVLSGLLVEWQGSQYRWIFVFAAVFFLLATVVMAALRKSDSYPVRESSTAA